MLQQCLHVGRQEHVRHVDVSGSTSDSAEQQHLAETSKWAFRVGRPGPHLIAKMWKGCCRALIQEASEADPSKLMRQRRKATVVYIGCKILVRVSSIMQEVEFWLVAKLKGKVHADKALDDLLSF